MYPSPTIWPTKTRRRSWPLFTFLFLKLSSTCPRAYATTPTLSYNPSSVSDLDCSINSGNSGCQNLWWDSQSNGARVTFGQGTSLHLRFQGTAVQSNGFQLPQGAKFIYTIDGGLETTIDTASSSSTFQFTTYFTQNNLDPNFPHDLVIRYDDDDSSSSDASEKKYWYVTSFQVEELDGSTVTVAADGSVSLGAALYWTPAVSSATSSETTTHSSIAASSTSQSTSTTEVTITFPATNTDTITLSPLSTSLPSPANVQNNSRHLNVAAIVGGLIGGVATLVILSILIWLSLRRKEDTKDVSRSHLIISRPESPRWAAFQFPTRPAPTVQQYENERRQMEFWPHMIHSSPLDDGEMGRGKRREEWTGTPNRASVSLFH